MKITSFNPLIASKEADSLIALFEELGFDRRHKSEGTNNDSGFQTTRMKDGNGFYVDIAKSETVPRDMTAIRMNVDDFEGAIELLKSHGFIIANGGRITDLGSSKSAFMMAPSGFCISVVKHIK